MARIGDFAGDQELMGVLDTQVFYNGSEITTPSFLDGFTQLIADGAPKARALRVKH